MAKQDIMFRDIPKDNRTREAHRKTESALKTLIEDIERVADENPHVSILYPIDVKAIEPSLIPIALGRIPTYFAKKGYEVRIRYYKGQHNVTLVKNPIASYGASNKINQL